MGTREEVVRLSLDDAFTSKMAKAAAMTAVLEHNLDSLNGTSVRSSRETANVSRDTDAMSRSMDKGGASIDQYSGRLTLLADAAATIGPALIPTAAAAVPLLAGLSNQLGIVAIAGGSTILAFQGVGDALKAVNEQAINPSAANLEKMHEAMAKLGPAGRDFVRELQSIRPEMQKLQDAAQAGLFPGMTEGIQALTTRLPQAQRIISEVTDTLGGLMADAGKSLAGPEWNDFFKMLESEARPTLQMLGESIGQVTKGLAELWIAFAPLNRDFSQGMLDASKNFAQWADGLSKTQGFADFMAYLQQTGPQVAETLGAMGNALLQLLEAAAPLGGPALAAIKAFSNAISAIASSDLGTPLLAAISLWRAYSLAVGVAGKATRSFVGSQAIAATGFTTMKKDSAQWLNFGAMSRTEMEKQRAAGERVRSTFLKGAAGAAALGVATTGIADGMGLSNTATLGLLGTMVGLNPVVGATAGFFIDAKASGDQFTDTINKMNAAAAAGDLSGMSNQLASLKAQVDDLRSTNGIGDLFSDWKKNVGRVLTGQSAVGGGFNSRSDAAVQAGQASLDALQRERGAGIANQQMAASAQLAAQGFHLTAAGAREAAAGIQGFTAAAAAANAALTRQGTLDAYRSSLLNLADSLKANGKTLATNTREGLANRAALRGIASSALEAAGNMKNFTNRTKFLEGARKSFVNAATAAGMTRAAAKRLADQLGLVDRMHVNPKIDVNTGPAFSGIHRIQAAINGVTGKTVTITVLRKQVGVGASAGGNLGVKGTGADGTTVPKTGQPYADRHLYLLADGEEVISNRHGQADRHRQLLKAINAGRMANGGTVGLADGGTARHDPNKHLTNALKELTKAINKDKAARDALISKRNDLSGTVRDQFTTDPFAGGNVWQAGGGSPLAILKADIAKAKAFKHQLGKLKQEGLKGDALAAIAATGDVGKATALASMGKAGVGQYQSLYNQRASIASSVGAYAGAAAYNPQIAATNKQLAVLTAEVKHLRKEAGQHAKTTGDHVGKHINKAAATAKRGSR